MLSRLDHLQSYEFQVNAGWEKTYVNLTKGTQKFFCSVNASNLTEKTQKSLHVENMLLWFIHMTYSNVTERNLCSFQYINYIGPVLERFPPDIFFPGDALLGLPWRIMSVNAHPTHNLTGRRPFGSSMKIYVGKCTSNPHYSPWYFYLC